MANNNIKNTTQRGATVPNLRPVSGVQNGATVPTMQPVPTGQQGGSSASSGVALVRRAVAVNPASLHKALSNNIHSTIYCLLSPGGIIRPAFGLIAVFFLTYLSRRLAFILSRFRS